MKSFLSLLLVLVAVAASAQNNPSNIRMSAEMKEKPDSYIEELIGFDGTTYYTWRKFGIKGIMFEAYDKNFALINSAEFVPDGKLEAVDTVIMLDGTIYALSLGYSNNWVEVSSYAYEIDKISLLRKGPSKQLFVENQTLPNKYNYCISNNGKLLAISKGFYKKNPGTITFGIRVKVFGGTLEQLWEKEIIDDGEKKFARWGSLIDNNGDVYLYGKRAKKSPKEAKKGEVNSTCVLLHLKDNGNWLKSYDIDVQEHFITDLGAIINDENKLVVIGFYSPENSGSIKGYLYTLVDVFKEEIISQGYKDFDPDFLALFNKKSVNKDGELKRHDLTKMLLRPDGGAILLAEEYWVSTSHSGPDTRTFYNYNDIFILNIKPDASLAWSTRIAKSQAIQDRQKDYTSFAYAVRGDKLFIIYNDSPDNISITSPVAMVEYTHFNNSLAVAVEVDAEGKVKKNALFSSEEEGQILRPKICVQINPQQMFLYADKGKSYRIGIVELE